jgi:serine/threonine protein phosphatase PrpC
LCTEHTPFRTDERERIKRAGGLIMTIGQRDGLEPVHENWESSNPPRIWSSNRYDKFPGCGFTRSIGDEIAHTLGVTARPELFTYPLTEEDRVIILATDGVTECKLNAQ